MTNNAYKFNNNAFKSILVILSALWLAVFAAASSGFADMRIRSWENWKTDFSRTNIVLSTIRSGGPSKDGIPAIDKPKFLTIAEAGALGDRDPVIGIEINGDARAYPLGVLMRHEIANDIIGGKAVAVTYCPLCNAAIVFDAMIDGKRHDFGTTGRLRNSDLVMYDRQTETWWQQFSGKALIGHYLGRKLHAIPSRMESFGNFKKRFPHGKVMAGESGSLSRYNINPYAGYDTSVRPFLWNGEMPEGVAAMERVIIVREADKPIIVSMLAVRKKGKMQVSGFDITWTEGQASALDTSRISNGREVGNITVTRMNGDRREDVVHDVTFAFVAQAFLPDTKIIK